jgi:4-hydroxybenzoate polyprenyltransferase
MNRLLELYRYANVLSLDVVAGAVSCALFLCKVLECRPDGVSIVVLGLSVWIIYTVDHLVDARSIGKKASSVRHRFHQDHSSILIFLVAAALLTNVTLLFFVPDHIVKNGFVVSVFVAVYLVFHQRLAYAKEFVVALFYTIGVSLPALGEHNFNEKNILLLMILFASAFLNLVLFSWFDYEEDLADGRSSLVTRLGKPFSERMIVFVFAIITVVALLNYSDDTFYWIFSIAGIQMLMFLLRDTDAGRRGYRLVGDIAFCIPLIYVLI